jgi:hypothetical protein
MCRLATLLLTAYAALAQTVHGLLVDSVTRAPLPDVIVTLIGTARYNGTTDEGGTNISNPSLAIRLRFGISIKPPKVSHDAIPVSSTTMYRTLGEPAAAMGGRYGSQSGPSRERPG